MALEVDANQSFIIYGAGMLGRIMQANLLNQGMQVDCFLDQRAETIGNVGNIPVHTPDDPQLSNLQKRLPVILAVSDYFAHETLAEMLCRYGFTLLIFKRDLIGGEQRHAVNALYDRLFEGGRLAGMHVERYLPRIRETMPFQAPLSEENGAITAYLPISLLFRSPRRAWSYSPERHVLHDTSPDPTAHWTLEDYPFYLNDPLCELFDSLRTGRGLQMAPVARHNMKLRERVFSVDNVLAGEMAARYVSHFQHMTKAFSLDPAFFVRHPAQVKWHERGYFFILDGNTRLAFLFSQGLTHVPCRMSAEDYWQWLKAPGLTEVTDYLQAHADVQVPTPIPHADFYPLPSQHENARRTALEAILDFLIDQDVALSRMRFADLRTGAGHFAQGLRRLGIEMTALEPDSVLFGLLQRLNVLLKCADIHSVEADWRTRELSLHDGVLLIDCVASPDPLSVKEIKQLDEMTASYLFYESFGFEEAEHVLAHSSFDTYRLLNESVRFGTVRYLVVFARTFQGKGIKEQ